MEKKALKPLVSSFRLSAAFLVGVTFLAATRLPAAAGLKACLPSITTCQCNAKKPIRYIVANDLVSGSKTLDCLSVSGAHAVIDLKGHSITGPGAGATAAGIHILASATGALVEGSGFKNSISGFGSGVQIDSSKVVVVSIELVSNTSFGLFINGGTNNAVYDLDAGKENDASSGNGVAGVMIKNGSNNFVDDIHAAHNTMYGIEISGGSNNSLHDLDGDFCGIYGIWINGSNGNRVVNSTGRFNSQLGLYIGCAPTGGVGGICPAPATGSANVVKFGQWASNTIDGIGIDSGDLANQIGISQVTSNGVADAVDANASCGSNLWFLNQFTLTPQACIK